MIGRTNAVVGSVSKLPTFTYTGSYTLLDDGDDNWRIKFLTSGTLVLTKTITVDIFTLGGGGGAVNNVTTNYVHGAGGGGYASTFSGIVLSAGASYPVVVGAGGAAMSDGGKSWMVAEAQFFANGGGRGQKLPLGTVRAGGSGGSGGASQVQEHYSGLLGGVDGSDGQNSVAGGYTLYGGYGQGRTTREFGEAGGTLYATGGGANSTLLSNTGNGGKSVASPLGSSGLVAIRNHRAA